MKETTTINEGRHYIIKNNKDTYYLPSVTTIIGFIEDKSWVQKWRDKVGHDVADQITKFSANRGTCMHLFCENYYKSPKISKKEKLIETLRITTEWAKNNITDAELIVGRQLFFNFYRFNTLDLVDKVVMQEDKLYSYMNGGYAGRVDLIYRDKNNNLIICDFKSSKRPKDINSIDGYKMQLSAYLVAYWEMYKSKPKFGEIWISNERDPVPQIIRINDNEIKFYFKKFINGVKKYHDKFGIIKNIK